MAFNRNSDNFEIHNNSYVVSRKIPNPQINVEERTVEIPKPIIKERNVNVPQIEWVEKIVEVPIYTYKERIIEVEKPVIVDNSYSQIEYSNEVNKSSVHHHSPLNQCHMNQINPIFFNPSTQTKINTNLNPFNWGYEYMIPPEYGYYPNNSKLMNIGNIDSVIQEGMNSISNDDTYDQKPLYRHIPKYVEVQIPYYKPVPIERFVDKEIVVPIELQLEKEISTPTVRPRYIHVPVEVSPSFMTNNKMNSMQSYYYLINEGIKQGKIPPNGMNAYSQHNNLQYSSSIHNNKKS